MRDYTTMRLGRRVGRGETIAVCPKCGRKGAYRRVTLLSGAAFDEYIHTVDVDDSTGIAFRLVREHCSVRAGAPAS